MIFTRKANVKSIHKQQGLTLLEMLIALAIVAILLSVVAPNIQVILNKNRITADINQMSALIQYARFSAIDQQQSAVVCPAADFATCSLNWSEAKIVFIDSNGNGDRDSDEDLLISTEASSAQQYFEGPNTALIFDETGASNTIATFKLCPISNDVALARSVNVNQQGRTRISIDSNNDNIHEDIDGTNLVCS